MATFHNGSSIWPDTVPANVWGLGGESLWEQLSSVANSLPPDTPVDARFELNIRTGIALVLTFGCGLLANAAGVGGGPFYIPVFNVLLGFNLKMASALSLTIVSSGALASTFYGLHKKSPRDCDRTLLDFDLALTFLPALLLGVNFGVLFNILIPEWLQTAVLVFVLIFVIRSTARKARQQWDLEQATLKRTVTDSAESALTADGLRQPLLDPPDVVTVTTAGDDITLERNDSVKTLTNGRPIVECHVTPVLENVPRGTKTLAQRIPFRKFAALLVLWVLFLVSQAQKSAYPRCTWEYMTVWGAQVAVLLLVGGWQIAHQVRKARRNDEDLDPEMRVILSHGSLSGGIRRPFTVLAQVAGVIATAGVGAGLLGVGGAIFFNPWLLHLGVHPQVTVSTAVLMILFSSSAIALSLSFHNLLNHSYALVFAPIAFVASTIGVTVVGRFVRKSGRSSIIVIILTVLVAAGTGTTAVFGGLRSYEQMRRGRGLDFHPLCSR
ncbi:hypothetical protein KFL_002350150 [Klebsormidium nitens]|uniref:Sulfite exporter TauE/SafE family protein n=1 Tax=Klebsormidium nitens TaxID=105231 RepID=A0A1Y1I3D1_KLENI|nr:hypothetical protein KFL_002350150 [Klebsormidium nitens]|eukprot:GAQ85440.1 hypothetical protein KFL_002350150 [Klebsormidium nitens]